MAENLTTHSSASSGRSASETRPAPSRTPSGRLTHISSANPSHRHSFTEQLRGMPPSPRAHRHSSFSQMQIQELLNNPPKGGAADPKFAGRDWQHIGIGELVDPREVLFAELDTSVEAATNVRRRFTVPDQPPGVSRAHEHH